MKAQKNLKHEPHLKLKSFLIENRILQKDVAKLLGITPISLNQKINGKYHFSLEEVETICAEYNVMPQIFFTGKLRNSNKNN